MSRDIFLPLRGKDADVLGHPAPADAIAESLGCGSALAHSVGTTLMSRRRPIEFYETAASVNGCRVGNHGPIRGSWPIALLGYPKGHRVGCETRCAKHHKAYHLSRYSPSNPSVSRTPIAAPIHGG